MDHTLHFLTESGSFNGSHEQDDCPAPLVTPAGVTNRLLLLLLLTNCILKYKNPIPNKRLAIILFEALCLCCPSDGSDKPCLFTSLSPDAIKLVNEQMKDAKVVLVENTRAAADQKAAAKKDVQSKKKDLLQNMTKGEKETYLKAERKKRDKARHDKEQALKTKGTVGKAKAAKAVKTASPKLKSPNDKEAFATAN